MATGLHPRPRPYLSSPSEEASRKQEGRQNLQFKQREPCSKDRARKSWEAILSLPYFGPAKVVKGRVGGGF
jgi:hypothetical protein